MARKLKTINSNGLVGEYLLNGNALDTSGSGNNGVGTNVTYTGTDRGYQSQCGVFNGSSSKIDISGVSTTISDNDFTLSTWINISSIPVLGRIYYFDNRDSSLYIRSDSGISFAFWNGTTEYNANIPLSNITTNKWLHILVLRSKTNGFGIYLNGVLIQNNNYTGNAVSQSHGTMIGAYATLNTQYFPGNIQSVRLFNRAISQQEIQTLYQEGLRQLGGEGYGTLFDGLVAYYDFNGDAQDIVGGNNGTVNGATLTTDRFGTSNRAYSFNGSNNYIQVNTSAQTNNYTLNFIIKSSDYQTFYRVIYDARLGANNGLLYTYSGNVVFDIPGAVNIFNYAAGLVNNTYYHITLTRSGSSWILYINGTQVATATNATSQPTTTGYKISREDGNGFSGVIDGYHIFNRVLSADEIKTLYQLSSTRYLLPN